MAGSGPEKCGQSGGSGWTAGRRSLSENRYKGKLPTEGGLGELEIGPEGGSRTIGAWPCIRTTCRKGTQRIIGQVDSVGLLGHEEARFFAALTKECASDTTQLADRAEID